MTLSHYLIFNFYLLPVFLIIKLIHIHVKFFKNVEKGGKWQSHVVSVPRENHWGIFLSNCVFRVALYSQVLLIPFNTSQTLSQAGKNSLKIYLMAIYYFITHIVFFILMQNILTSLLAEQKAYFNFFFWYFKLSCNYYLCSEILNLS